MAFISALTLRAAARARRAGNVKKALAVLDGAVAAGGRDPRLSLARARLTGDFSPILNDPGSFAHAPGVLIVAARGALRAGDASAACRALDAARAAAPRNTALDTLSALALVSRDGVGALAVARTAVLDATPGAQSLALLAVEEALIAKDPADRGAKLRDEPLGGAIGAALGLLDDAAVWLGWAIGHLLNLIVNFGDANKRAAYRLVTEGDRLSGFFRDDEAAEKFRKALRHDPHNPEALESLITYSLTRGETDAAEAHLAALEKATEGNPPPSHARWRGDILFLRGQWREALEHYVSVEPAFKLDYHLPYRMGLCRLRLGERAAAVELFERAMCHAHPGLLEERLGRFSA
ncbi:MAG: hypothetical protein HY804_00265 [Nitrospinae bacterium]|nr:hypothetical protein [Nitrospinota bacterium]